MVQIYRFESSNKSYYYDLPKDKKNKMHDDRAYTMAMLGWYLKELRRENITKKENKAGLLKAEDLFFFKTQKFRR